MYLRDLAASLRRRWYLAIVFVALAGVVGLGLAHYVKPTYEAKAEIVLLPPKGGPDKVVNPYLGLGGLPGVVDVLTASMSTQANKKLLKGIAPDAKFTVQQDANSAAPIIDFDATSKVPAQATTLLRALVAQVPVHLHELQNGVAVSTSDYVTEVVVSQDIKPKAVQKTRIRIVAAGTVAALAGGLSGIGLIDGLLMRRRAGKQRTDEEEESPTAPAAAAPLAPPTGPALAAPAPAPATGATPAAPTAPPAPQPTVQPAAQPAPQPVAPPAPQPAAQPTSQPAPQPVAAPAPAAAAGQQPSQPTAAPVTTPVTPASPPATTAAPAAPAQATGAATARKPADGPSDGSPHPAAKSAAPEATDAGQSTATKTPPDDPAKPRKRRTRTRTRPASSAEGQPTPQTEPAVQAKADTAPAPAADEPEDDAQPAATPAEPEASEHGRIVANATAAPLKGPVAGSVTSANGNGKLRRRNSDFEPLEPPVPQAPSTEGATDGAANGDSDGDVELADAPTQR